jgi:hypothetical protein
MICPGVAKLRFLQAQLFSTNCNRPEYKMCLNHEEQSRAVLLAPKGEKMKRAVCIGINNYPGTLNDLKGCVNDANDWAELLREFSFDVEVLLDNQGTRENIKTALRNMVSGLLPGDYGVFTYSGHGTYNRDTGGDETDSYDEALYVYDGLCWMTSCAKFWTTCAWRQSGVHFRQLLLRDRHEADR